MTITRARGAAFLAALIVAWTVLLLLVAGVRWDTPLTSAGHRVFAGSRFHSVFGTAQPADQRLQVTAPGEDLSSLQTTQLPELDAAQFPILSYRFEGFPSALELSFVFRTEDGSDVETISVPAPTSSRAVTVDLSDVPAWKGRIVEMGFAQFPVAQLAPPGSAFRPFVFASATLHGASWLGKLKAMSSAWTARAPWQFISVSALGPSEIGDTSPHALRPPLVVALALGIAALLAWLILRLRGRRFARFVAIAFGIAWLVLDLFWLHDLGDKRRVDRDLWGAIPLEQRQNYVADSDLVEAAARLKDVLRNEPRTRHILLSSTTPKTSIRFIYHAAPLNISVATALPEALRAGPPPGTIIVRYDLPNAAKNGLLAFGGRSLRVKALEEGPRLSVYRVLGVKP